MHRIDGAGATVDDKFTKGDPQQAIPATEVTPEWLNAVQEELAGVVAVGEALDKADNGQLLRALRRQSQLVYAADFDYAADDYCIGSDGQLYRAVAANGPSTVAVDPVADGPVGTTWVQVGYRRTVTFTASGTYIPPAGVKALEFIATGGGGGGGGTDGQGAGTGATSGSGGAGATAIKRTTTIEASYAITIGVGGSGGAAGNNNGSPGGTTTVVGGASVNISAGGGTGGDGMIGTTGGGSNGGTGGTAAGGDANLSGGDGSGSRVVSSAASSFSVAGSSFFGGGGKSNPTSTGAAGKAPGSGGGGNISNNTAADFSGGDGADGIVIIKETF